MTESVSAGEVCSIAVAKSIGIRDESTNTSYYLKEFSDVKTFNEEKDTTNNYKLCETTNSKDTLAAPLCVLQSGAGFGFTKKKSPGSVSYDTCVTAECPTGFVVDPKKPNTCLKPRTADVTILDNVVEERWYDWFMVPDYHIGNKYQRNDSINYAPCKTGSIPSYQEDKVDGLKRSFNSSAKDDLGKCVEKAKYFGGKYLDSDTYCPLAWVYRAGATNKDLKMMYNDLLNDIDKTERGTSSLDTLKNNVDNLIYSEIYKPVISYGFEDYVGKSQTDEATAACSSIERGHPERRNQAFQICTTIKEIGKEKYIEKLMDENSEDENTSKKKYKRAIQACHTLFCDEEDTKKICFPEVEEKGFDKKNNKDTKEAKIVDPEADKKKITTTMMYIIIIIIIIIICALGYILFNPIFNLAFKLLKNFIGFCVKGFLRVVLTLPFLNKKAGN
jgi:hypothetical protein